MDKRLLAIQSGIYLGALAVMYPICSGIESLLGDESFLQTLKDPTSTIKASAYAVAIPMGLLSTLYNSRD